MKYSFLTRYCFVGLFLLIVSVSGAQTASDTLIRMDKQTAIEFEEYRKYVEENKGDLVPDFSEEWMITDRPHIAETPHLTANGYLQWETGAQYQNTKSNGYSNDEYTYNTTLFRMGFSRRIEGRLQIDYMGTKSVQMSNDSIVQQANGFAGLSIGSKVFLFQQKGIRPETSLLYGINLPYLGSETFRPSYTGSEIKFLLVNRITKWYEFEYNLGMQWDGVVANAAYAYAFNNEFEINKHFFFFLETYGFFYENGDQNNTFNGTFTSDCRINGGIWYLFNGNTQLDLSGGFGVSKVSPDYYVSVGFSNRFRYKSKKS